MLSNIAVSIPTKQFLELANFLHSNNDPRDPVDVVSAAIDYWMDNASWKPELLSKTDTQGYQWKNVFLPSGTQIRMQYKGEYSYAKVEGDSVIFNGKSISPSVLANTIAGGSRNAWRDLWIKRPGPTGEKEWKLADDIRHLADQTQKSSEKFLRLVDEKGEEAGLKAIEATLGKECTENGIEWGEDSAKKQLEWMRATFGQVKS